MCCQANLAVQEARLQAAMSDLNEAQAKLDEKQRELDVVQALYDKAMAEKQVCQHDLIQLYSYKIPSSSILKCILWLTWLLIML